MHTQHLHELRWSCFPIAIAARSLTCLTHSLCELGETSAYSAVKSSYSLQIIESLF
jgi:hypothetical protein